MCSRRQMEAGRRALQRIVTGHGRRLRARPACARRRRPTLRRSTPPPAPHRRFEARRARPPRLGPRTPGRLCVSGPRPAPPQTPPPPPPAAPGWPGMRRAPRARRRFRGRAPRPADQSGWETSDSPVSRVEAPASNCRAPVDPPAACLPRDLHPPPLALQTPRVQARNKRTHGAHACAP